MLVIEFLGTPYSGKSYYKDEIEKDIFFKNFKIYDYRQNFFCNLTDIENVNLIRKNILKFYCNKPRVNIKKKVLSIKKKKNFLNRYFQNEINKLIKLKSDSFKKKNIELSKLVNDYLKAISDSGIRYVEIGFRSLKENKLNGPNFFSRDNYLNILKIPKNLNIGVMINISEIINSKQNYKKILTTLLKNSKETNERNKNLNRWIDELFASHEISSLIKSNKKIIIDSEGFIHRLNSFVMASNDKSFIESYLKVCPKPDILIYIKEDLSIINERIKNTENNEDKEKYKFTLENIFNNSQIIYEEMKKYSTKIFLLNSKNFVDVNNEIIEYMKNLN